MAKFQNTEETTSSGDSPPRSPRHIYLDGRTLEGGGQLVRNALALSALTSRPVTVNHVRGNRGGGGGLKSSHAAAVKLLAEISGSKVTGGQVGSQHITFEPETPRCEEGALPSTSHRSSLVSLSDLTVRSEYNIKLPTPGSVFLIFQALYPYLLHVGSRAATDWVKVTITGGTNGTSAPCYDYASQVMAPNFARLGLPPLSLVLHKRGWTMGPIEMGSVSFLIHPLSSLENEQGVPDTRFPQINVMDHERGKITQIDLTVLAPDTDLPQEREPVRKYIEKETRRSLRKAFRDIDLSIFNIYPEDNDDDLSNRARLVPINTHTSEPTNHASQVYILLVAHTSTGLRIGRDALIGSGKPSGPPKKKHKNTKKAPKHHHNKRDNNSQTEAERITGCIDDLVAGFLQEITNYDLVNQESPLSTPKRRSVFDEYMRDQIVVFEALGEVHGNSSPNPKSSQVQEDEQFWSLHTQTAQWVCQKMLLETDPEQIQTLRTPQSQRLNFQVIAGPHLSIPQT